MKLATELLEILSPAYAPCRRFFDTCASMRWDPEKGFVPRGFLGACGQLSEVELVLVSAEPGDPWSDECHPGLESAHRYAWEAFSNRGSLYHKNIRKILDGCWPNTSFEQQLRKTWITDSVLCSAARESGHVKRAVSMACGKEYLLAQLALFPDALVVALGSKARDRLAALHVDFLSVAAVAPPGCNYRGAQNSWDGIAPRLSERRRKRSANG